MDDCGYDFVITVKGMASPVGALITEHKGTFESSREIHVFQLSVSVLYNQGSL
jgi:hypothetical protein